MVSYDPAFAYELAYIVESGLARMFGDNPENVYFYITVYNEPYPQPPEPDNFDPEGLLRGIYRYHTATEPRTRASAQFPRLVTKWHSGPNAGQRPGCLAKCLALVDEKRRPRTRN